MAIIKTDSVVKGITGAMGNLIFRQVYGKTIVSAKPSAMHRQSKQQRETRTKFKAASACAQLAMRDPEKKAWFWCKAKECNLPNAYTAAVSHYMHHEYDKPLVSEVERLTRCDVENNSDHGLQ